MSKLVEGVVVQQVTQHINNNNLDNPRQSAYKISHIKNKIHLSLSRGEPTALVLLDLFAAFVTIDHTTLLNCLKSWICVRYSLEVVHILSQPCTDSKQLKLDQPSLNYLSFFFGVAQGSVSPWSSVVPLIHHSFE